MNWLRKNAGSWKSLCGRSLADIQDTSCESFDEIKDEVLVFFGYVRQFMEVFEDRRRKSTLILISAWL
jgi:hypothetical protein